MNITKQQLKETVLSQASDVGFIANLAQECIKLLPEIERQQVLTILQIDLNLVDEYYIAHNVISDVRYYFLSSHEVFLHIYKTNPSVTRTALYSAISRKSKIKNYIVFKTIVNRIKKED